VTARSGSVFLLTDYGLRDEFVGLVHAAVRRLAPAAPVVDLTHGVPPFDVVAGARALARCVPHLGPGVVVGVVDPGVGTDRRSVAVAVTGPSRSAGPGPTHLVGPDNGLLSLAADLLGGVTEAVALPAADGACTFDGRDVFAPAAARLWLGEPLAALGTPVDPSALVHLPPARCQVDAGSITAEVQWVDRFGNAQLVARPDDLTAAGLTGPDLSLTVVAAADLSPAVASGTDLGQAAGLRAPGQGTPTSVPLRRARTFDDVGHGFGLVIDASGWLAVVRRQASAAAKLGVQVGAVVTLRGDGGRDEGGGA
jgi:S-adenosylmethionine hydrolase